MTRQRPELPYKHIILRGKTAKVFRSIADSYVDPNSETEQSILFTIAYGTVIDEDALERIQARLYERNQFLKYWQWNVDLAFRKGNPHDAFDADGCLIDLWHDECCEEEETEADRNEYKNAKNILARVFYEERVKPFVDDKGEAFYLSEPDGGERMQSLEDDWAFNAKFIVAAGRHWMTGDADFEHEFGFGRMAKKEFEEHPEWYDHEGTWGSRLRGWDYERYGKFPLLAEDKKRIDDERSDV